MPRPRRRQGADRVDFNVPLDGWRGRRRHPDPRRDADDRADPRAGRPRRCSSRTSAGPEGRDPSLSMAPSRAGSPSFSTPRCGLAPGVVGDEVERRAGELERGGGADAREQPLRARRDGERPGARQGARAARGRLRQRRLRRRPPRARDHRGRRPRASRLRRAPARARGARADRRSRRSGPAAGRRARRCQGRRTRSASSSASSRPRTGC